MPNIIFPKYTIRTHLDDLIKQKGRLGNELQKLQRMTRELEDDDDDEERADIAKKEAQVQLELACATAELELYRAEQEGDDPIRIEKLKSDWVVEKLRYKVHLGKLENPGDPELNKIQDEIDRLVKDGFGGA